MRLLMLLASVVVAKYVPGKAFDRFITIWLENQDFKLVEANGNMNTIANQGILLTQYYGLTHPSQPNYLASVAGDYFGLNHDEVVKIPRNVSTLVDLLETKNIDWKGYFEAIPGPGYMGEGGPPGPKRAWRYVRKHNPFVSFDSINMNGSRLAKIQSLVAFQNDVAANKLPQYAHISPNMNNDGHDTNLSFAANWTLDFLKPLLANRQFMKKTLVLLTYDESETVSIPNRIVSLLVGGAIPKKLRGTKDNHFYTHYSILSTLENNWGLPNLGRYDVGANVFQFVADKTGYRNKVPLNMALINNSLSYDGFLNNKPTGYLPLPPPNLRLTGAGGKGVEASICSTWETTSIELTPYDGSGSIYDGGDGQNLFNIPAYKALESGPEKSEAFRGVIISVNWAALSCSVFAMAASVF